MTVVLFCGGQGRRLRERTDDAPKPLTPIGADPLIRHLMRYYAHHGHRHFVLCLGHGAEAIVEHFAARRGRLAADPASGAGVRVALRGDDVPWTVDLVTTPPAASLGDRLRAARSSIEGATFLCNYADGLSDLDLPRFVADFTASGAVAGLISVRAPWSAHLVSVDQGGRVTGLASAPEADLRINGGFFAMRREVFEYLGPGEDLVADVFPRLVGAGRLFGHRHDGFWACVDTPQDVRALRERDARGQAPWKVWLPTPTARAAAPAEALR